MLALAAILGMTVSAASGDTILVWSDDELTALSAAIVTGRVADIATGLDVRTGAIYTYVTIAVDEAIKGAIAEREIVIKQLGGEIGDEGLAVAGQAGFVAGEDVLLFLEARPRDGTLYTSALWQGKWTVTRDAATGERVALRRASDGLRRGPFGTEPERRLLEPMVARMRRATALTRQPAARAFAASPAAEELRSAVHTASLARPSALFASPWRWNEFDAKSPIPIVMQSTGQPGLAGGGSAELVSAAASWSHATGLLFTTTAGSPRCFGAGARDGRVSVSFDDPCAEISDSGGTLAIGGASYSYSGGTTVNGVTFGRGVAGYVVNNDSAAAARHLTNSGCFQTIQTHEIGHVLGLAHSADPGAIMFGSVSFASCSSGPRALGSDDLAGIRAVYPPRAAMSPTTAAPAAPAGLTASSTASGVALSWSAPAIGDAPTSYVIEAGTSSGTANSASFSTGNTATSYSMVGVGAGTYFVRVKAANAAGISSASNQARVVVAGGCTAAPAAPSGLSVISNSGGRVSLSWTAAAGSPTTYVIEAGSIPGSTNLAHSDLAGTATTFTTSGVARGTYYVRLRARNACGTGTPSNELAVVVP